MVFHDRSYAGSVLANKISEISFNANNTIVLAIPNGGVPVGFEIAKRFKIPFDIFLTSKITAPSFSELVVGLVGENNQYIYNESLLKRLGIGISDLNLKKEQALEKLHKKSVVLRKEYPGFPLGIKDIILVDDGSTSIEIIELVIKLLRNQYSGKINFAIPLSTTEHINRLEKSADSVTAFLVDSEIGAVGGWYENFSEVENEEIKDILSEFTALLDEVNPINFNIKREVFYIKGNIYKSDNIKAWVIVSEIYEQGKIGFNQIKIIQKIVKAGYGVLMLDLPQRQENIKESDVSFFAKKFISTIDWFTEEKYYQSGTPIAFLTEGLAGASLLMSINNINQHNLIYSNIILNGRTDLVDKKTLNLIYIPTLLVINESDLELVEVNKISAESLPNSRIALVPKADEILVNNLENDMVSTIIIDWLDNHIVRDQNMPIGD